MWILALALLSGIQLAQPRSKQGEKIMVHFLIIFLETFVQP